MFRDFVTQWARLSRGAVTTRDEYLDYFAPHCVDNLLRLLRETGLAIVFTTNRRGETDLARMWAHRYGSDTLVLGSTPALDYSEGYIRGDEIAAWLTAYEGPPVTVYAITDDTGPDFFHPAQRQYLVQCDERWGFGSAELDQVLKILAG